MSEAIIARGGRKGGEYSSGSRLVTEVYTSSTIWVVPNNAVNNTFSVRIFGGGGGGAYMASDGEFFANAGGGGGWMNNAELSLIPGDFIGIEIGKGATAQIMFSNNISGSLSGFVYWGGSGGTTFFGNYLSANGGHGGQERSGGIGGSGGAGNRTGGSGIQFGGGSGSTSGGGAGGPWGGGGGTTHTGLTARGGTYGGNGANRTVQEENGTNTIGWTNIAQELNGSYITGHGAAGNSSGAGGGGFGGNGGNYYGGGGGYGADGGNYYGGGGGYGKGGYGGNGRVSGCGGGGSYGRGASFLYESALFGGGGAGGEIYGWSLSSEYLCTNGADGICIIQYYTA